MKCIVIAAVFVNVPQRSWGPQMTLPPALRLAILADSHPF